MADWRNVVRRKMCCFFSYSSQVRNFSCSAWNSLTTSPYSNTEKKRYEAVSEAARLIPCTCTSSRDVSIAEAKKTVTCFLLLGQVPSAEHTTEHQAWKSNSALQRPVTVVKAELVLEHCNEQWATGTPKAFLFPANLLWGFFILVFRKWTQFPSTCYLISCTRQAKRMSLSLFCWHHFCFLLPLLKAETLSPSGSA